MKPGRRVRMVSGRSGLESLRSAWQSLTDAWPEAPFYVLYDWYWACLHDLQDDPEQVIFVVLEDESGCRGILPLRRERQQRIGVALDIWSVPGCIVINLADLLLLPGERLGDWWSEIGAALRSINFGWVALKIPGVLEQGTTVSQASTLRRNVIFRPQGYSGYFQINNSYESLSARYTTRLRKILRKGWSGLARLGTVDIHTARTGPELASGFFEFVRLEATGWKGEGGTATALAQDPPRRAFCEHVFSGPGTEPHAEINLLTVGGCAVAAQLCMVRGGVRSVVKIAHEQSLQKFSPGSVLLDALLKRTCKERDVYSVSLVTGLGWMREWGTDSATVGDLWLFRSRLAAAVLRGILHLKDRREAGRAAITPAPER